MTLSANTNVASTVANYFNDNYTALLQAGTTVPGSAYAAPATQAFADWKIANADRKFYLEKSGESYKLASVSGGDRLPEGTEAVDLNVAYAIESKEMTLVDWMMAKIGEEIRQANSAQAFGSLLTFVPEADLNFDPSSMDQADLASLLKRLNRANSDLKTAASLGDISDQKVSTAALGLTASLLGAAMEQQRLFEEEAATLTTGTEAEAAASAQSTLTQAQSTLGSATARLDAATVTRDAAQTALQGKVLVRDGIGAALQAAQAPGSKATAGDIAQLQIAYDTAQANVITAQTTLTEAQAALENADTVLISAQATAERAKTDADEAQAKLEAADNFNEVTSAALAKLVANFTADMDAAQLAYTETASSNVATTQLRALTSSASGALNSRLMSAADLALLNNPSIALFSELDVLATDDGYVVGTSAMASRDMQRAAVRAVLKEALSDPALQTALADAMAANADSLGTADLALPVQTQLYNEVAAAVISSMSSNDAYLDKLAGNAVDFGSQLSRMLGNELVSASKRDSAILSSMN